MIKHIWTIVCSKASIDEQSHNASVFNVLEQINVLEEIRDPKPVLAFSFEVLTCWIRENSEIPCRGRQRLTLIDPQNEQLAHIELDINLAKTERARNRFQLNGLPLSIAGRYFFRTDFQEDGESDWQTVHEYPLTINISTHTLEVEESGAPAGVIGESGSNSP
jgi:hypothetical protein